MMTTADTDVPIGRQVAFESFFAATYARLVRAMYLLTGSVAESEDLAQEALARAFERWERVRRMDSPQGYLFRVALNLNRRRIRRLLVISSKLPRGRAELTDPAGAVEARSDVLRTLLSLPPKQREVLILAEFIGMSGEEIATFIGIRSDAVRKRLHRARGSFRHRLGEGYE